MPKSKKPAKDTPVGREVSLFRNGSNQAVRIPRDLELPGDRALLRQHGDQLILEPLPALGLLKVLATLPAMPDAALDVLDPPADAVDL